MAQSLITPAQTAALIRAVPYFASLSEDELMLVQARLVERRYRAGQIVFLAEDECAGLHLVISGQARIYRMSLEGR